MLAPAFGVYVHFPYCAQRCSYCDFAVVVRRTIQHERYRDAVLAELAGKSAWFPGRRAVSVYFGGGTPSLWRPDCIAEVLAACLSQFPTPTGCTPEVTVECDPADLSTECLAGLRAAGVNRLSLGAQTFAPKRLAMLGRRHTPDDIVAAVAAAQAVGFENISLDLIIGQAGQRGVDLQRDLDALVALQPTHVSLYLLTVEPGTALAARVRAKRAPAPHPERQARAYRQVCTELARSGFAHYEISNFAAQGAGLDRRSVHNRLYWTGGEYLGLGVGAHSFRRPPVAAPSLPIGQRFANDRALEPFLGLWAGRGAPPLPSSIVLSPEAPGLALFEDLASATLAREALWLFLRRIDGFSQRAFQAEFGIDPLAELGAPMQQLVARGLVALEPVVGQADLRIRLTEEGLLFADEVGAALM